MVTSQPTRGLDVGSIEFVHERIVATRDSGIPVLIVATELDEATQLGDRIAVMYRGKIVGIVPSSLPDDANPYCDIVIPTGLGVGRNLLVALGGQALIIISGGSGTLSEAAFAWQCGRPIVALSCSGGWADKLGGTRLDDRSRPAIEKASSPREAVKLALSSMSV